MSFQHLAVAALLSIPSFAHGQADSVVLRITSPRGTEVLFSGVITLKGAETERRLDKVRTPFELKLPAQHIDARFTAADGGALRGDIVTYREGKQRGHVTGTMYFGEVKLYFEPGLAFGFGARIARVLSP
jgi:hypothetical protein